MWALGEKRPILLKLLKRLADLCRDIEEEVPLSEIGRIERMWVDTWKKRLKTTGEVVVYRRFRVRIDGRTYAFNLGGLELKNFDFIIAGYYLERLYWICRKVPEEVLERAEKEETHSPTQTEHSEGEDAELEEVRDYRGEEGEDEEAEFEYQLIKDLRGLVGVRQEDLEKVG